MIQSSVDVVRGRIKSYLKQKNRIPGDG